MSGVCLDHLAIAARNERQVTKIIDETLCGKRFGHTPFQDDVPQSAATWLLDQHKLEILSTPISGKDSLVGKFLNARPSVEAVFHHVTFTVGEEPSRLRDFRDKASKLGFEIVGYNERPYKSESWGEFFLSPKTSPSKILVQIAVYKPDENELKLGEKTLQEWNKRIVQHKALFDRPAALEGLLLQVADAKSMQLARTLFGTFLGGFELALQGGIIRFSFPNSAHKIYVVPGHVPSCKILMRNADLERLKDSPMLKDVFASWKERAKL